MNTIKLALWIVLAVAQLALPAWTIVGEERILRQGRQIKLQTRPVDPADVFRGRYVALGFAVEEVPRALVRGEFQHGDTGYLELREGPNGFAEVVALHKEMPEGELVLRGEVNFLTPETVGIQLPFDRYYMDEHDAPQAEAVYRERALDEPQESFVLLRVLRGRAAIEELYVGGKPVRDLLRKAAQ
jgi:hypothetical protein